MLQRRDIALLASKQFSERAEQPTAENALDE